MLRVLMMADRSFARREHAMLRRLEVGLIDEGVRVLRATPAGSPEEPTTGLAGTVSYDDRGLWALAPSPVAAIRRAALGRSGSGVSALKLRSAPPLQRAVNTHRHPT